MRRREGDCPSSGPRAKPQASSADSPHCQQLATVAVLLRVLALVLLAVVVLVVHYSLLCCCVADPAVTAMASEGAIRV